ncbi:MAG: molybdenum cofactor guanylyltransferase [Actinomycetota bacterium]|jgi:molybdopterin-guanine dinucleotide biosynthesis protein A|nr:molybdenum cofactor guanylyltransferase [Actinomycetota bacterium]
MGRDKAWLDPGDGSGSLAARAARALQAAGLDPLFEVGPGASPLETVADPGLGPLMAVATAARRLPTGLDAVVLACDMPDVGEDLLRYLAQHPAAGSVVPVADGHPQVLCARWSAADLQRAIAQADGGERSLRTLLGPDDVTFVTEDEWSGHAPAHAFVDLDTAADLAEWQREMMEPW